MISASFPEPVPGQVIRYSYLWSSEFEAGREEGTKDRLCAVVLTVQERNGKHVVIVLPITHTPPRDQDEAVELPTDTKRRLGLDDERSWVVVAEFNRFVWPGPDLRPMRNGDPASMIYGTLPRTFFDTLMRRFTARARSRKTTPVPRSE